MLNGEEIRKALISWLNYPPDTSASLSSLAEHMVRKANQFGAVTAPYYIEMASHIEALEAENERLREALRFYSGMYEPGLSSPNEGPWGVDSDDFGDVARQALSQAK